MPKPYRGVGRPEEAADPGYRWAYLDGHWNQVPEKMHAGYFGAVNSRFDQGCFRLTMIALFVALGLFAIVILGVVALLVF